MTSFEVYIQLAKYFTHELKDMRRMVEIGASWFVPREAFPRCVDRAFGALLFAQDMGAEFEAVDALWNEFKEDLEEIAGFEIR